MRKIGIMAMSLVMAAVAATAACAPAEAEVLEGIIQNVDSANGEITMTTKDGKTVTLKITTKTEVENEEAGPASETLRPGASVEVEVQKKEQIARRIKVRPPAMGDREITSERVGWGIVEIRVTDPPPADVRSAVVYLSNIEVHKVSDRTADNVSESDNNSGWIPIGGNIPSFDLMDVIGVAQLLASANVTAGSFTQIRMNVVKVEGVTTDNVSYSAEVPGDKLRIVGAFNVGGGTKTILTLDFDGEKSLIRTGQGKFLFKPVVKLLVNSGGKTAPEGGTGKPSETGKPGTTGNATETKGGERKKP